ncbi:MAG TPA: hypothetical protein VI136_16560 [Verrucomicrobiae bacterium]
MRYDHAILRPERVHDPIERVKAMQAGGRRLLAGTSYGGGTIPKENVVRASEFLLLHGNGVSNPDRIAEMVRQTRAVPGYTPKPILFNEDDHFDFDVSVSADASCSRSGGCGKTGGDEDFKRFCATSARAHFPDPTGAIAGRV